MKITRLIAREIFDSRGLPTIQCELFLENGMSVTASVPAGTSKGMYEAQELRDGDERLFGQGVKKAIENIEFVIAPAIIGQEPHAVEMDLKLIDLDGTPDKSRLGTNALLATSMVLYRAEALLEQVQLYEMIAHVMAAESVTLPFPLINMISGGAHAHNTLRIQEFLAIPVGTANFRTALEAGILVSHELQQMLLSHGKHVERSLEGGFACNFENDIEALDILYQAIEAVQTKYKLTCVIGLDIAASQFYNPTTKLYTWHDQQLSSDDLIKFYEDAVSSYPIYCLEDGLSDQDVEGWVALTEALENKVQIVGDDLFATNIFRIDKLSQINAATAVVIKPNQIGTITEALQAVKLCKARGLNTIISHRSGETEDSFIADLAVGASAGHIKAGGCSRSERMAKYNRLLTIEDDLTLALLNS